MRAFLDQQLVIKPLGFHEKRLQPDYKMHSPSRIGAEDSGGAGYHESVSLVTYVL
jgi:hypothetical protein